MRKSLAAASAKICLIDGNAMLYQNYYGTLKIKYPFINPKGIRVNGVYGFLKKILRIISSEEYGGISVLWDHPSPTFRKLKYPLYKSNRSKTPPDLIPQFHIARQAVEACQIHQFQIPTYEADDIIATLSNKLSKEKVHVEILTGDKDLLQVVNPYVVCKRLQNDKVYDVSTVVNEYGINPEQIPELFALIGDAVDNLPGIPSIGKARGRQLLQTFNSIENIVNLCNHKCKKDLESMKYGKLLVTVQNYLNEKHFDVISLEDAMELNTLVSNVKDIEFLSVSEIIEDCKYPTLPQDRNELQTLPLNDFLVEHNFKSLM